MVRRLHIWCCVLALCLATSAWAGSKQRRVEELASVRTHAASSELRLASGELLSIDLARIEVIDRAHPARPARRALKLAPAGSGLVIDFRLDRQGQLRFGRLYILKDRASAEQFMQAEFGAETRP